MVAFQKSLELGVDIELDVQRCASGELVVIHDEDLARTTNGVGQVSDINYDEINRLSAGLWFDSDFSNEKVPLLSDLLNLVDGQVTLNIEVKNAPVAYDDIEEELLTMLSDYGHNDKIIVSSFDHYVIQRLRSMDASLQLALLLDGVLIDMAQYAQNLGVNYFHPCLGSCRADIVKEAQAAGLRVNVWNANGRRAWSQAIRMGVDGIVTDDPAGLMVLLGRAVLVED